MIQEFNYSRLSDAKAKVDELLNERLLEMGFWSPKIKNERVSTLFFDIESFLRRLMIQLHVYEQPGLPPYRYVYGLVKRRLFRKNTPRDVIWHVEIGMHQPFNKGMLIQVVQVK